MSIEFVDPEPVATAAAPAGPEPARSAVPGRLFAGVTALAAVLAGVALTRPLYEVVRTASIVDFDRTIQVRARIPVDAFGDPTAAALDPAEGVADTGVTVTATVPDGVSYGTWWIGVVVVLALVAVVAFAAPRSTRPAAVVAAAGGVLLGSVGAAWLAIRTVAATSVPQIRLAAEPGSGLWLLVAAGALALVAGLLRATRPPLRRLLPRRRVV